MYSVMLAAMLTTTSAAPDWGNCHGCCGGAFCHGYPACSGWNSCHGCCGGCYGCRGYNAFSGCCGGCYGCSGCCGGCWGCSGCCGGVVIYSGCCGGCCGGWTSASCYGCCGGAAVSPPKSPTAQEEEIRKLKEEIQKLKGAKPKSEEVSAPAPAHVVVKLPEEARLFVDETPCPLTSATRAFDTPELQPGQVYYYTLRAEATRDGLPVKESKRVTLRAGQETVVEFGGMQTVEAVRR